MISSNSNKLNFEVKQLKYSGIRIKCNEAESGNEVEPSDAEFIEVHHRSKCKLRERAWTRDVW